MTESGGWTDRTLAGFRRTVEASLWPYLCASALCILAMAEVVVTTAHQPYMGPFVFVLPLPATLPFALARSQPVAAAALLGLTTTLIMIADTRPPFAGFVALVVACYLAGLRSTRRAVLALAALLGVAALLSTSAQSHGTRAYLLVMVILAAAAGAAGIAAQASATATNRQISDLAIADTLTEHAARGERARIARELHDVVAHHISMISAQAEAARITTAGMPPDGAKRLLAIGETARSALTEMRRLLGVLREDAGDDQTRRPQPGLHQLNELVDQARHLTSASTRLLVRGGVTPLDPGVELTAYRVVQEALTNARRHAPGAAIDVELDYRPDALHVRVRDNGPGSAPFIVPAGHGLTGMHERVTTVGGSLATGPTTSGGYLVEAVLPTRAAPP